MSLSRRVLGLVLLAAPRGAQTPPSPATSRAANPDPDSVDYRAGITVEAIRRAIAGAAGR